MTPEGETEPLHDVSRPGRVVRVALVVVAAILLLSGTLWGGDDHFPFGPFHMYAGYYPPTGTITSTAIIGVNAEGHQSYVTQTQTGIPRGAIEGQLSDYIHDPRKLGGLASAYLRRFPHATPFVDLKLVQKRWQLDNRRVVGTSTVTLAEWHAP
ncbi:MAG: hypothetical protein JO246_18760 [Frankiaceae bacterium]|nr:hypothetical protein [Frankiaceae bacterium]MBV9871930.1 hypothetical protein [Frankiaceae bacterium]